MILLLKKKVNVSLKKIIKKEIFYIFKRNVYEVFNVFLILICYNLDKFFKCY